MNANVKNANVNTTTATGAAATNMCPVVHFEMPAKDRARAAAFYAGAFGWQMNQLGEDMGHYLLATTADSDVPGPGHRGSIGGGFFSPMPGMTGTGTSVVIAVAELEPAIERVRQFGGKITGEAMDIPGVGRFISFEDTEGNGNSMLQPLMGDSCPAAI